MSYRYDTPMESALLVYLLGAAVGAWRTDGALGARAVHALLWPVGPLAFVVTVGVLLAASLVAFPRIAAAILALGALVWWVVAR